MISEYMTPAHGLNVFDAARENVELALRAGY
jgi:hypothetical protein